MRLLTSQAMRALDRATIESGRASGETLMERAGLGVARAMERRYGPMLGLRVLALCGVGNNGGDGFVAARHLAERGARVCVVLLAPRAAVRGDALIHLGRYEAECGDVAIATCGTDVEREAAAFDAWDFALDALLGTGSRGEPEGLMATGVEVLRTLDELGTRVVAVDLPTGVSADSGAIARRAVRADLTVTFGAPKRGHFLYPGRAFTGALEVVDIGLADPPAGDPDYAVEVATHEGLAPGVAVRDPRAHKGSVGRVLVIGGSAGLTGAVALAARAATRAGAGYVQMLVPASLADLLEAKLTEEMTLAAPETPARTLAGAASAIALEKAAAADAVVLGPGLSREGESLELVRRLTREIAKPMIVDADALFAFVDEPLALRDPAGARIVTPHLGEMSRLTGLDAAALDLDRIDAARRWAREWNVVVLLKGAPTVTAAPDGRATVNPSGNPGMATAGAGDVLAGAIAALVAQGLEPYEAACLGAYIHGMAGDLRAQQIGQQGIAAGDLAELLPNALFELAKHRDAALASRRDS
ncbi:MAG: NAD(P)H-hydrate dehydratase [Candidatus Eisenbacteria bacterium]|nr:NAD(P)H-hydrate dehydratase [Candidatus Eisenbacteria bacterium]